MTRAFHAGLALVLLAAGSAAAQDAARGGALAEAWCADCHVIAPDGAGGGAGPSFESVANREGEEAANLSGWLGDPHPPMPNMSLTRAEIDDLTAYILSLRR